MSTIKSMLTFLRCCYYIIHDIATQRQPFLPTVGAVVGRVVEDAPNGNGGKGV